MDAQENIRQLVAYIATTLARNPDAVRVDAVLENGDLEVNLMVAQDDMGRLIGRQGRVAHAIRALVKAAHADPELHVMLNIDPWPDAADGDQAAAPFRDA